MLLLTSLDVWLAVWLDGSRMEVEVGVVEEASSGAVASAVAEVVAAADGRAAINVRSSDESCWSDDSLSVV